MKNVILIDGNNLLFRSYFATAYSGNILRNSKGFPTNAIYGYINMINKILNEESPEYIMVAFDKGKTFRHEKYVDYKNGRKETPEELKVQFPLAKEMTSAMGITYFEIDNYEADDIIGTFAEKIENSKDFKCTIISSDKDLLQLIGKKVEVKLLKQSDFIRYNESKLFEDYGFEPSHIVDLKALMGDPSDHIPGVKGIGEKTALKLLHEFKTLEGVYENIDSIKGKIKEKLISDKDNAFFSYELATIYKEVPVNLDIEKIKYLGIGADYIELLKENEFFSLLKKLDLKTKTEKVEFETIYDTNFRVLEDSSILIETKGNYHDKDIIGISIYNKKQSVFIPKGIINKEMFGNFKYYTYDLKKLVVSLKYLGIDFNNDCDDLYIASYLLDYKVNEDISSLMRLFMENEKSFSEILKNKDLNEEYILSSMSRKTKFIFEKQEEILDNLSKEHFEIYKKIELPLVYVLSDMEFVGVYVDKKVLEEMKDEIKIKLDLLSVEIFNLAGEEFNILSPKQLGIVLFEKLKIPYPKKNKKSYSTGIEILKKLTDYVIVQKVLEYRALAKLYSNYASGLLDFIKDDGKIHTTYNQTLTRTGRLSSTNPNLQNIPIRSEYGRLIRKAFIASDKHVLLSGDYSQIELRVFAHMSKEANLVDAFKHGLDIHTKTAMDIYGINKEEVDANMRRNAKAVNFGILYGISSFGLSEDLGIDFKEAKKFIDKYLETFPGIKEFMDKLKKDAHENGYVKTLLGRTRVIDEIRSSNYMVKTAGERMALNTPIQGTAADILKLAMIDLYKKMNDKNLKSKIILQVHDELILDVSKDELKEVRGLVKDVMENAYKLEVPLRVDINEGNSWYSAK